VPLAAPGTWVVIGSSTASGAGAKVAAWPTLVQRTYAVNAVTLVNLAKGGTTTYAALPTSTPPVTGRPLVDSTANIDAALSRSPKLVLVAYPTNDTSFGYAENETVNNLMTVRNAGIAGGAAVMILGTQPANFTPAKLQTLANIDARIAAAIGGCFVPVREALAGPDGKLAPQYDSGDGEHPNDAGHQVIADKVSQAVNSGQCVRLQ
jgi:acyl-CoA thioesterase I